MHRFWKTYFWVLVVLVSTDIVLRVVFNTVSALPLGIQFSFWGTFALSTVLPSAMALAGLYGYTYSRKILIAPLWKVFSILAIGLFVSGIYDDIATARDLSARFAVQYSLREELQSSALWWTVELPGLVALILYGFCRKDIWQETG